MELRSESFACGAGGSFSHHPHGGSSVLRRDLEALFDAYNGNCQEIGASGRSHSQFV